MTATCKVLQVLGRSTGGIAAHVADLVESLDGREGLEISIAAPPEMRSLMPKAILPLAIPDGAWGHGSVVRQLRRLASAGGYHVIHAHGLRASLDSGRAARDAPVRNVATIHNLVLPEIAGRLRARAYRQTESLAVRWNDRVLAPSGDIATRLAEAAPSHAGRIEVLHLGVRTSTSELRPRAEVRSDLGLQAADRLVVTVARLAPQKALDVLLQAHALLPTDVHLAIVGSGPLEHELTALTVSLGLASRVRFLGFVANPQDLIAAADVFALSSVWEACSLAAQEAMHLHVPVVSTAVGGMGELIEDGVTGRLVARGDVEGFARAVGELLDDPAQGRRLADKAAEFVGEHFSRASMLERLRNLYRGQQPASG